MLPFDALVFRKIIVKYLQKCMFFFLHFRVRKSRFYMEPSTNVRY